jgi:predicted metal-dependent phosphoesterase TrpH
MAVDLHIHSEASDGSQSAEAIVREAAEKGLRAISITDHDSIRRVMDALLAGKKHGIEVVPGVEIGVKDEEERDLREVHILGYFFEWRADFVETLLRLEGAKIEWLKAQVERLKGYGTIDMESVLRDHGDRLMIRRPHLWETFGALNPSFPREEFYALTNAGGPCHVSKTFELTLEDAVALIRRAGGSPVLAHPGDYYADLGKADDLVALAERAGIAGIEVYYPYTRGRTERTAAECEAIIRHFEELAEKRGLLKTGGSDAHGRYKEIEIGEIEVPDACLEALKAYKKKDAGP